MMLLGSLVNMLAIFAGCFVGVTLGRFIPERFNSAIEKGIALCVFYIGLDGVLAGSDTLVAILSMVLGVILAIVLVALLASGAALFGGAVADLCAGYDSGTFETTAGELITCP